MRAPVTTASTELRTQHDCHVHSSAASGTFSVGTATQEMAGVSVWFYRADISGVIASGAHAAFRTPLGFHSVGGAGWL